MGWIMTRDPNNTEELVQRAGGGDRQALADLFARHRERLWRMIHLRLDRRLQGRLDSDDVLQETYLVYMRRFPEFAAHPGVPFYRYQRVWNDNVTLVAKRPMRFTQP